MDATRIAAIALVVAGALALAYGGFSYTRDSRTADIGPFRLAVEDRNRVNIPVWAGTGILLVGGLCVALAFRR